MLRALSLYLPNWSIERTRRREELSRDASRGEALILARTEHQRPVVAACCGIASSAGVTPGMSVADARALIRSGRVRIEEHRADRDVAALVSLARWALRFSPVAAPDAPDGLLLNVTGCAHLYGGEDRLARGIERAAGRLGFTSRAVIAPSYAGAWALARYAQGSVCLGDMESLRAALAPLPVGALRVEDGVVDALAEVGVATIGELLALPRGALASRFGAGVLGRMDAALGLAPESIEPVRERTPPRAERCLDGPTVSLEALGIVTRGLLADVGAALRERCAGVRRLDAVFDRPGLTPVMVTVTLARPTRDVRHLWSLLWPRMERMHLGDGVERVELTAARIGRMREVQMNRWAAEEEEREDGRALVELCETLANRLGGDRVLRGREIDTHAPERAIGFAPALTTRRRADPVAARPGRPSLLLDEPEGVRVMSVDFPAIPAALVWRGETRALVTSLGPERIGDEWWAQRESSRDYFKVQDEAGRWLWVFRDERSGRWFVHGVWA